MSKKLTRFMALLLACALLFEQSSFAQVAGQLDISSRLVSLRNSLIVERFRPLHLRSLAYEPQGNSFNLLLDKGDAKELKDATVEETTKKLLQYFFIGISLPNESFWVNLRPDTPESIIDPFVEETDIGKVLLEADLQLKKDTAGYTNPTTPEGKAYWEKLYQKAEELFGNESLQIPTLTRPWIVPGEIIVRETSTNAYIYKATLKVMLEQDYLKDSSQYNFKDPRLKVLNEYASQLIRELILPKLIKDVNTAKRYAPLRQVYYSLILAQWFKARFMGQSGLLPVRIDQKNLTGLTSLTRWSTQTYYQAYKKSFADGEYNLKTPAYTPYGQTIRSYFSGGITLLAGKITSVAGNVQRQLPQGPSTIRLAVEMLPATGEGAVPIAIKQISLSSAEPTVSTLAKLPVASPQGVPGKTLLTNRRNFLKTTIAAAIGWMLPGAAPRVWSATNVEARDSFRAFLQQAAFMMPLKPFQELPVLTPSEARLKAAQVIEMFNAFEIKVKLADAHTLGKDFEKFYRDLLILLPPDDFKFKLEIMKKGKFEEGDVKRLYIKVRDYLLTCRVLAIYKGFNEFHVSDGTQTKTFLHYSFDADVYFINEVTHLGVPVVSPLLGSRTSFPAGEHGDTSNGIPFIAGASIDTYVAFVQKHREQPLLQSFGDLSFREAFVTGITSQNGSGTQISTLRFEGRRSAFWFAMGKLVAMQKTEADVQSAAKLGTASHEQQHAADFMNSAEAAISEKLASREQEKRAELRARIAALRYAPWDSIFGLLGELEVKGNLQQYQVAKQEIYATAVKIILDNPELFAKVIEPMDEETKSKLRLTDRGEINVTAQLYKFAMPEYEPELKLLTQKVAEALGLPDLFKEPAAQASSGSEVKSAILASSVPVIPSVTHLTPDAEKEYRLAVELTRGTVREGFIRPGLRIFIDDKVFDEYRTCILRHSDSDSEVLALSGAFVRREPEREAAEPILRDIHDRFFGYLYNRFGQKFDRVVTVAADSSRENTRHEVMHDVTRGSAENYPGAFQSLADTLYALLLRDENCLAAFAAFSRTSPDFLKRDSRIVKEALQEFIPNFFSGEWAAPDIAAQSKQQYAYLLAAMHAAEGVKRSFNEVGFILPAPGSRLTSVAEEKARDAILDQVVYETRAALGTIYARSTGEAESSDADFLSQATSGKCEQGAGDIGKRIKSFFGIDAEIKVYHLKRTPGGNTTHAFMVVALPNKKAYLVDPTLIQFFRREGPVDKQREAGQLLTVTEQQRGLAVVDELLNRGYAEFTPEIVALYQVVFGEHLEVDERPIFGLTGFERIAFAVFTPEQAQERADRLRRTEEAELARSATGATGKGGIDLRALPIMRQPAPSLGTVPLARQGKAQAGTVPIADLDKEWDAIQEMLAGGIIPSSQRIKEYLLAGCQSQENGQCFDKALSCIAGILRLEEERCCDTDTSLREIMALVESNAPASELRLALSGINIEEKGQTQAQELFP